MSKKLLSILMAVVLAVGLLPGAAFGDSLTADIIAGEGGAVSGEAVSDPLVAGQPVVGGGHDDLSNGGFRPQEGDGHNYSWYEERISNKKVFSLSGETTMLLSDYMSKYKVIIFGGVSCCTCCGDPLIKQAAELASDEKMTDVQFFVVNPYNDDDAFAAEFKEFESPNFIAMDNEAYERSQYIYDEETGEYYCSGTGPDTYSSWFIREWGYFKEGYSGMFKSWCLTTPAVLFVAKDGIVLGADESPDLIEKLAEYFGIDASTLGGGSGDGGSMVDVSLEVTYGQTDARTMLDNINSFRVGDGAWAWNANNTQKEWCKGLKPLAYDYELERIAMYRAAEIALSFSHTTLDGKSTANAMAGGLSVWGENIAAGNSSAAETFVQWREDDELYSGQGHRRNMLSGDYTSVGIGHVVCNGVHYWVQEFGAPTLNTTATEPDDSTRIVSLRVSTSIITNRSILVDVENIAMSPGDSMELPKVTASIGTKDTWPNATTPIITGQPSWSIEDTAVAKVSGDRVEAVGLGETRLKVTVALDRNVDRFIPIKVATNEYALSSVNLTYNKVSRKKNLLKDVVTFDPENKNTPVSLAVKFKNSPSDVGKIQLVQTENHGKGKNGVIATANDERQFAGLQIKDFKENAKFSVRVYDADGRLRSTSTLTLKVQGNSDNSASIDFSDGFTFEIKDGVLAGKSIEFGDLSCPITSQVTTDGKLQVGINFDLGEDESILEQLKKGANLKTSASDLKRAMLNPAMGKSLAKSAFSPSFSLIGYAEGAVGSPVLKGMISIEVGGSMYAEFQAGIFVGELSGGLKGKGQASAQLDLSQDAKHMVKNGAFDLGGTGTLGAYGGVGAAYVASIGIYGKASLDAMYRLMPQRQAGWLDVTANGELGVKAKALGRDIANIAFVKGEYPFYRRDGDYNLSSMVSAVSESSKINTEEAYPLVEAGAPAADSWSEPGSLNTQSADGAGVSVLASNVYGDSAPRVVTAGGTAALFFLDNAPGRSGANKPRLMYSILDPSTAAWSAPLPVADDGTADFAFDVYGNGSSVDVVWQNAERPLDEGDTLGDVAGSVGLSYARLDVASKGVSDVEAVTTPDGAYAMLPRVASDGAQVEVAWVSNDARSVSGTDGSNTVAKATRPLSGSSWSSASLAELGSAVPTSIDAGVDGSAVSVAWSYDEDGDLNDLSDSAVASESRGAIAEGSVGHVLFSGWNGGSSLMYFKDGGVLTADGSQVMPEGAMENSSFELVPGGDALFAIQSYAAGGSSAVMARSCDGASGEWSEPYEAVKVDGSFQQVSATAVNGVPVFAGAVERGGSAESDGSYDLAVSGSGAARAVVRSVECDGAPTAAGGEASLVAKVANEGFSVLESPAFEVYDGASGKVADFVYEGAIAPGEAVDVPFGVHVEPSGSRVTYRVAPAGASSEEGQSIEIATANLALETNQQVIGADEVVSIDVSNTGLVATAASSVEVFDWESGEVLETMAVPALQAGETASLEYAPGGFLREKVDSVLGVRLACSEQQVSTEDDLSPISPWDGDSVEQEGYAADESPWTLVAKPTATNFTYDGKAHAGVPAGEGYTLSGTPSATEVGTYIATATLKEGYQWSDGTTDAVTLTWRINARAINPTPTPITTPTKTTASRAMHRLYNPYSGEHFYTADANERNTLTGLGWRYEGVGWNAPTTGANVYRLYNRFSGDHHFTTNAGEKDACVAAGWTYEGVGWKSGGSVKVYREYNPYADCFYHNYTKDAKEHRYLCSIGWKDEGIGWYGV